MQFTIAHHGALYRHRAIPLGSISMSSNYILSRLSRAQFALLEPHLEAVELPVRTRLEEHNKRVENVYFLERGFACVVAIGECPIEIGMIGREGMTGLSVVTGNNDRAQYETSMQMAGNGFRIKAGDLREAIDASVPLHRILLHSVHAFMQQTMQTALANGCGKIEVRLSRWLLMAGDRVDGDELPITHEFLGLMLCDSRPRVTVALKKLQQAGLISHKRRVIIILDREGLRAQSQGTYFPLNDQ
jgi:CRP-like cAMP-binding protein